MAKFKYSQPLFTEDMFGGELDLKIKQKHTVAVWTDDETGTQIKATGKNFERSEDNDDFLSAGKIFSVTVTDGDKDLVLTASNLNLKATKVMAAYEDGGAWGVAYYVTKGDDTVIGSKKGEQLIGGAGDDTMTGGKGSDYFLFHAEMVWAEKQKVDTAEHDVITDFQWKGENADQLQYIGEFEYRSIHSKQDTILTWEDGSTLLLEGVKKAEFETWMENNMVL